VIWVEHEAVVVCGANAGAMVRGMKGKKIRLADRATCEANRIRDDGVNNPSIQLYSTTPNKKMGTNPSLSTKR
jgi:hypothetical protein